MIDPFRIPERFTRAYLEEFILFSICVANKPAARTAAKVDAFLRELQGGTPFRKIEYMISSRRLDTLLRKHRMGQYKRIERAFKEVIQIDLRQLSVATLEKVNGIGPKTARFIMLYYQPNSNIVPLDTHILKFLRDLGYTVPKSTPTGKRYVELEAAFLAEAAKRNMTAKQLDTFVWQQKALTAPRTIS